MDSSDKLWQGVSIAPKTLVSVKLSLNRQRNLSPIATMPEALVFLIAIIIAIVVFTWLVRIVKVGLRLAIALAVLVLLLQLAFGIGPQELWLQMSRFFQNLGEFLGLR